ncbi:SDR family NAD(P)-dependent oxidoreductase [Streptomyces sp. BE308]|uniref:SDR family NAD(P)-dependent oxidoreductase n=1 Tax=unclassified Streptomyces TaxID=2593676 RepID=UPI002E791155|nr:SDR family NAD(P)-dependent oxidoreductase [Streptomyces sp. BE308]MEE1796917.1 SDR family NAD(P)-dependent oxidoreductase [Streptomyces sp. BE308]
MKNIVIQGGTDGMGRALGLARLHRGDAVLIIGRDAAKGASFLAEAAAMGAGERATFVQADLSLISENQRVIESIAARFPTLDALVLCARHYLSARRETAEGIEGTFALFYLSRFLLGHGLRPLLEKGEQPVIMNVAGPGSPMGEIHWTDLEMKRDYNGLVAQMQGGKANDLLGVAFAEEYGTGGIRYVLFNPGSVSTSFSGEYDPATKAHIEGMKRMAKPVEAGIAPILTVLDAPPAEPVSAFVEGRRMGLTDKSFDTHDAKRLATLTRELLAR